MSIFYFNNKTFTLGKISSKKNTYCGPNFERLVINNLKSLLPSHKLVATQFKREDQIIADMVLLNKDENRIDILGFYNSPVYLKKLFIQAENIRNNATYTDNYFEKLKELKKNNETVSCMDGRIIIISPCDFTPGKYLEIKEKSEKHNIPIDIYTLLLIDSTVIFEKRLSTLTDKSS